MQSYTQTEWQSVKVACDTFENDTLRNAILLSGNKHT